MRYRSSNITHIAIASGVPSANIGVSNVVVNADGTWESSIPAAELRISAQDTGSGGISGRNNNPTDNNSGTGW